MGEGPAGAGAAAPDEGHIARTATIANRRGLHARAAARFVKLAGQFDAEVTVCKGGMEVSGRSIMGLMMLAAAQGTDIEIRVRGPDADRAMRALLDLIEGRFEED